MASTKDKVQEVLSEVRTLALGAQILLGFQYQALFRPRFGELPAHARSLGAVAFGLLVAAVALLIAPSALHHIREEGEATRRQHAYTKAMVGAALVLLVPAVGSNVAMTVNLHLGATLAAALGAATAAVAALFWFGIPPMRRSRRPGSHPPDEQGGGDEQVPLKDKPKDLLMEARIVLPGSQALLGLQLAAYLTEAFEKLSPAAKAVHTASMLLIALSMVLLMASAPYHRLAEGGEHTERFDRVGVRFVLGALVPLSLGLAGGLYVVLEKVSGRGGLALLGAAASAVGALLFWFGVPLLARRRPVGAR